MSINLPALATWSYTKGTLTHVASGQSISFDVEANSELHDALATGQWKNKGPRGVYSSNPADWVERKVRFNRATETPPVIGVEKAFESNQFDWYTITEAENLPAGLEYVDDLATLLNIPLAKARKMVVLITKAQRARGLY